MPKLKTLTREGKLLKPLGRNQASIFFIFSLSQFVYSITHAWFHRLPTAVRDNLGAASADAIANKIAELNAERGPTEVVAAGTPSTVAGSPKLAKSRTLCRPIYESDEQPINPQRMVENFVTLSQQEFELDKVSLGLQRKNLLLTKIQY